MQAISGAGYPGVASMDINANVIPFIGGEEEKMQQETQKILGDLTGDAIRSAGRQGQRALQSRSGGGWPHGGGFAWSRRSRAEADLIEAIETLPAFRSSASCRARRHIPCIYMPTADRPQPRRDVERDHGMAVFVGRLRECPVLDYKFIALGHNTIRGAAGAAVLNAELMNSKAARLWGSRHCAIGAGLGASHDCDEVRRHLRRIRRSHRTRSRDRARPRLDRQPVVVVSAMGKTTNRLLGIAIEPSRAARRGHHASCVSCAIFICANRAWSDTVEDHFQELSELMRGLAILGELTPRSIDALSSYGERLSSLIVANLSSTMACAPCTWIRAS